MIEFKDVWKTFPLSARQRSELGLEAEERVLHAVAGVSFTCRPGRVFTLLGPNGAGKTTALRMVATLMRPTAGQISVLGMDVTERPQEVRRRIGFLTGTTRPYERLTPNELMRYYADLYGMDEELFKRRRNELFELLGISEFANRRIGKLSSGMRQRVSIARTIIHDPEVVVFDEPTQGLDVIAARHIIQLIRDCRQAGKTVLFSTHIMGEVSLLADDVAILHRGRICFLGTYQDLVTNMRAKTLEDEFVRIVQEASA